jgi:iron complex outermembrane receptor protein
MYLSYRKKITTYLKWIIGWGVLSFFCFVDAQTPADSLQTFSADTVQVVSRPPILAAFDLPTDISEIAISSATGHSLSDLLSYQKSIFIKRYGGEEGTQSISMRGLDAAHTLITLDGIPLSNPQLGSVNLSAYLLDADTEIDIYRGGNASLFGSGAIGGVVNLRPSLSNKRYNRISVGTGAFGNRFISAALSLPIAGTLHTISFSDKFGENRYTFRANGQRYIRQNSDYQRRQLNYVGRWQLNASQNLDWQIFVTDALSGSPRSFNGGDYQGRARIENRQGLGRLKWEAEQDNGIRLSAQFYLKYDNMLYSDPDIVINHKPLHSTHLNREAGNVFQYYHKLNDKIRLISGFEAAYTQANSTDLTDNSERVRIAGYGMIQYTMILGNKAVLQLQSVAREENYSDFGNIFLPKIGAKMQYSSVEWFVNWGKNFRAPTFNDLYWQPGGNPQLKPETSTGWDSGISSELTAIGAWKWSLNYYHTTLVDMIRWVPLDNGIWQPMNLDNVVSEGIEGAVSASFLNRHIQLGSNYRYGLTKLKKSRSNTALVGNRLPYLPSTQWRINANFTLRNVTLSTIWQFTSFRYTTIANRLADTLPSYQTVDVSLKVPIHIYQTSVMLFGDVENLFRQSYQLIKGYPLPLQTWKIGLQIEMK